MNDHDMLKSALSATPECLTPEQLETLLDGKQSHPHLANCPRCQAELAMLKSFESGSPLPDEGAAVAWISSHLDRNLANIKAPSGQRGLRVRVQDFEPRISWMAKIFPRGGWQWAVPAIALVAAAIMVAVLVKPQKEPQLQASAGNSNLVYRSQEVQLVSPVGDVLQVPRQLSWTGFPKTGIYKVAVMEVDNSVLWNAETKATSVEIPASLRARMLPGKPILWQVTAFDSQGRVLGASQVQRFSIPRSSSSQEAQQSR